MTTDAPMNRRARITDEHRADAARLKAIWDSRPHRTQVAFGEHYGLGNQANVGHYLLARSPLNPKAAVAFATELNCQVEAFSPRVAMEIAKLSLLGPGEGRLDDSTADWTKDAECPARETMLNGKELGQAIEEAYRLKKASGVIASKSDVAQHFGIQTPSVYDWIKKGSISKDKLPELWRYFSDVVGPEHWGLPTWPWISESVDTAEQPHPLSSRVTNLRKLIDHRFSGVTVDFARAADISPAQVSQWFSGYRSIGEKAARKIESALVLPVGSLDIDGNHLPQEISLSRNLDYPTVRRAQITFSVAATGFDVSYDTVLETHEQAPLAFPRSWYNQRGLSPMKLLAVQVNSNNMEPNLWNGDTVVINTADTEPKDGEVFALNYEGKLVINRMVRDAGQWWLTSDNSDQTRYPRKLHHNGVQLLGHIVHKQSDRI